MTIRTRFAPSPTGPLHLGHAYSAIVSHDLARAAGGQFLLRIEDTDTERSRPEWEALILRDLAWLGLTWDGAPRRQSDHLADYDRALDDLGARGLLFPCSCNRADIRAAATAPHEGEPLAGPDGIVYPGTCRARPFSSRRPGDALRLNMTRALAEIGDPGALAWHDSGPVAPGIHALNPGILRNGVGDVVLSRRLLGTAAYHLAVTLDDARQGITLVTRGADLIEATQIHVVLQALLGLPTPAYHHHDLIRDDTGVRLAKRDNAQAIRSYRENGATPGDVRALIGLRR